MIDIKLIRENSDLVKENIKKKFQDEKLGLVDEVYELDKTYREYKTEADTLRGKRNNLSESIGNLMREGKMAEVSNTKRQVIEINMRIEEIEAKETSLEEEIKKRMLVIPNIIDESVPLGKDDSENVEVEKFGDPIVPDFEIPYHADLCEALDGLDKESAGRTSGNGFYYLTGDIARLHSALISYARDFMIDKGFTYCVPPFMIRSDVVNGVMSFEEMDAMMYKIENEDLFLIGTSEHSMIGRFKDQIIKEETLPITLTSYSPCFRKEVGAHGLEERGLYRVHQFEKQEMVVLCKKEDAMDWYKSCDIEAWSPRQKKYFEVGSCSTLGDAQARRLSIRAKGENGNYLVSTLNNTVIASPRGMIAVIENNVNEDGSINIPKALQSYMGGKVKIVLRK